MENFLDLSLACPRERFFLCESALLFIFIFSIHCDSFGIDDLAMLRVVELFM